MVRKHGQLVTIKKGEHQIAERHEIILPRCFVKVHLIDAAKHHVALKHGNILIFTYMPFLGAVIAFGETKINEAYFWIQSVFVS